MVNIMKASLFSFLHLANTSPIRALDGMICIDSEIVFQTEHSCYERAGVIYMYNVSGMLLVTLFILTCMILKVTCTVCSR